MVTVETVIVVISLASMAIVVLGAAGVMHQLAKASAQPAEYAGHHHKPARPSRLRVLADSVLATVGELGAAHALLRGVQP